MQLNKFQRRLLLLVGCAILADVVGGRLHVSERLGHEVVVIVLTLGAVVFANDALWSRKLFWGIISGAVFLGALLLWALEIYYPRPPAVAVVFLLCLVGGWSVDQFINRVAKSEGW